MIRRALISLLGGAAAWPLAARAQQGERVRRVGVLIAGLTEKDSEGQLRMAAFRQGLQNLGWIERRNVHIEERWPGGNSERLRSFAAELVGMRPDAIFAGNEAATMALHQTGDTVPIVFAQVSDPVANGLVVSPARPGGNLTGFALWEYGFAAKWGERYIAREYVQAGGLLSYGPSFTDIYRRAGDFIDKILRGTKPGAIPVEQPTKFDLVINLTTAKALRVTIPPMLLSRADEVIE
jgi:ABC-type uncharacterized transport system substrate-binding protein